MTQRESAAAWLPRVEAQTIRPLGRVGRGLLIAVAAIVVAQYLAGYFFLWSLNADPRQATPLTIARYGYYFSGHEHVRTRLIVASSVGAALVILTGGAFLLPRRRSLHGDARLSLIHI